MYLLFVKLLFLASFPCLRCVFTSQDVYVCFLSVSLSLLRSEEGHHRMGCEAIFCYLGSMEQGILICCSIFTILHGRTKLWRKKKLQPSFIIYLFQIIEVNFYSLKIIIVWSSFNFSQNDVGWTQLCSCQEIVSRNISAIQYLFNSI